MSPRTSKKASQNELKQRLALAHQMGGALGLREYEDESGLMRSFRNTTGFKGVYLERGGKFVAQIFTFDGE